MFLKMRTSLLMTTPSFYRKEQTLEEGKARGSVIIEDAPYETKKWLFLDCQMLVQDETMVCARCVGGKRKFVEENIFSHFPKRSWKTKCLLMRFIHIIRLQRASMTQFPRKCRWRKSKCTRRFNKARNRKLSSLVDDAVKRKGRTNFADFEIKA